MKPNDKAFEAALAALKNMYFIGNKILRGWAIKIVTDAYAAQFQSEDYAGLVKKLRERARYDGWATEDVFSGEVADALEVLLAERDALKAVVEIYEKKLNGIEDEIRFAAQSAIAATRPHIEAAERERCAKIADERYWDANQSDGHIEGWNGAVKTIAAAIRSGK